MTEILCITSSSFDERSASSFEGSLFTRACFDCLSVEKKRRSHIGTLLMNIQRGIVNNATVYAIRKNEKLIRPKQTCSICSTHPYIPVIWGWTVGRPNVDITFHPESLSVFIRILDNGR